MSFEPIPQNKEDRLSIRATSFEKAILAKAAQVRHMNVSQFVLHASLREAEQIVRDETTVQVSERDFGWLCEIMDAGNDAPRLREAVKKKPVWDA
jgi:uncharacterized protein (DUF1778 family)